MKPSVSIQHKALLIIKTEAIGDYILFRNFIKSIKQSEKFKGFSLTLIGNEIWKPLCLKYDKDLVDHFIFIDKFQFQNVTVYRREKLIEINAKGYTYILNATYSREFLMGDSIIRSTTAEHKIGMYGDSVSEIPLFHTISNKFYTKLIQIPEHIFFEFDRMKYFFETVTEETIQLTAPYINEKNDRKQLAVILPGAQAALRRWSPLKFKTVAEYLHQKYAYEIFICGGKEDYALGALMTDQNNEGYLHNRCGIDTLDKLPAILSVARLVICNDSGTLHISAAVNTPAVCISNANHYKRFTPYPEKLNKHLKFIYPATFLKKYMNENDRMEAVKYGSTFSIDEIQTAEVITEINNLLQ
ncbi:MAG: glycosyltransferase family 9 protein [Bacteroidia bacterium]|nr:glycosyltransferase family 9 protein [Bacteroidia bacterium]